MKRLILSIWTILYFTLSLGAVVNVHYCMDAINSLDLWNKSEACASCGNENPQADCCSNETHVFKLEIEQDIQPEASVNLQPVVVEALLGLLGYLLPQDISHQITPAVVTEQPPGLSEVPLFIHHCTYLI